MKKPRIWTTRLLILAVVLTLTGAPQLLQAQQAQPPAQDQQQTQQQTPAQDRGMVNPSQPPLQPAPQTEEVPAAPSAQQPTQAEQQGQQTQQQKQERPLGAAVGQQGPTTGGPASRPAGTAIAPAKQRQMRSLLIKIGALAAGAAAIGTMFALSKGSPSKPPGAK